MAAKHGKGMLVNISTDAVARLEEASYEVNYNLAESSGAGDSKEYVQGQADGTLTGTAVWDEGDAAQDAIADGDQISVTYFPGGTGENYSGTMTVESVGVTSSKDDVVRRTFTAKGVLTKAAT